MGRSNVGKSSLINMLVNRKNLVKTGAKPGVTRTINFFLINDKISIADLPGYGYAKLPKSLKDSFIPMIQQYITNRNNLKLAFLLIDIRRKPDQFEYDTISFLIDNEIPVAIILTKCDKLSKNARKKNINEIIKILGVDKDAIVLTSSHTGEGKREALKIIDNFSQ